MNFIKVIFSKVFLINLVLGIIVVFLGVQITLYALKSYTNHGETITVPDLRGLTLDQADNYLENKHLVYFVLDSSFAVDLPPTAILDQDPPPQSKVKENRKIYVTVNAVNPPQVKMPSLIDKSLRQATLELESWGLKVGELKYKPDLAQNAVLDQQLRGQHISSGTLVSKGTAIDLILGDGLGTTKVEVPMLKGLTLEEAKFVLTATYLNIGAIVYDETVTDSAAAMIFKQLPEYNVDYPVSLKMGESIDLFLTQEIPDWVPADSVKANSK